MSPLTLVFLVLFIVVGAYAAWQRALVAVVLALAAIAAILDVL